MTATFVLAIAGAVIGLFAYTCALDWILDRIWRRRSETAAAITPAERPRTDVGQLVLHALRGEFGPGGHRR